MTIILEKIVKPTGCYGHSDNIISEDDAKKYCDSCWPNEQDNIIKGFIWTQYLTKKDYELYTKNPDKRQEIKKQILSLLKGVRLKTHEERVKELEKALKSVVKNFPEDVLIDQMNEEYDLIEKALKKSIKYNG